MGRPAAALRVFRSRAGIRGATLGLCAALDILYGAALLAGHAPAATFATSLLSLTSWAWVWIGTGLVLLTGVPLAAGRDRFHFALAVLIKCAWGALILTDWIHRTTPGGWGAAVPWFTLAALTVIISGWRE